MFHPSEANSGQFHPAGTQQPHGVKASRRGGHRGRRPAHDDTGIARELARASSASCLHRRGSRRGNPWESTALSKLPLERGPFPFLRATPKSLTKPVKFAVEPVAPDVAASGFPGENGYRRSCDGHLV